MNADWSVVLTVLAEQGGRALRQSLLAPLQQRLPGQPGAGRVWQVLAAMEAAGWLLRETAGWRVWLLPGRAAGAAPPATVLPPATLTLAQLAVGDVHRATAVRVLDTGVFFDLGGVIALCHVSDLAWDAPAHPSDCVQAGEQLNVRVLAIDAARGRVSVGLKQLQPDPWSGLLTRLPVGTVCTGRLLHWHRYGAFVELVPGVLGFLHQSDLGERGPAELPVDSEVAVRVLAVDDSLRRVSLALAAPVLPRPDPFVEFAKVHERGDLVSGRIVAKVDHGVFVGLAEGVDGFVHRDDLPAGPVDWQRRFALGQAMLLMITGIDLPRRRIALAAPPPPSVLVRDPLDG